MNFHLEGQIVEIVIPHVDDMGNQITPTAISAELYDGDGFIVANLGAIAIGSEGSSTITILGELNDLAEDEVKAARVVKVEITHATGFVHKTHIYGVEAEQSLRVVKNSFQTYAQALVTVSDMVNATKFIQSSVDRQKAALVEAFWKISRLPLVFRPTDQDGRELPEVLLSSASWPMSLEDFNQLPKPLIQALRMAQVNEAEETLQGNVLARKHAQGIASETIGESSVTLRAGFSNSSSGLYGGSGISSSTATLLSAFIDTRAYIARA